MLGWNRRPESSSTGIPDPISRFVDVGDPPGLWRGDLGGINMLEGILGDVEPKKLGDKGEGPGGSGLEGLLLERGAMIPSEFLRERLRGILGAGTSERAFDHIETKRLERCALPTDGSKSS